MSKHRRQGAITTRRIATTAVAAASAAVAVPAVAQGAEVVIPNTDYRFEVAGLENVPNINQVPNIQQYVPSLQQENVNYAASVQASAPAAAPAQSAGQKALAAARSVIGAPYVYGANGPSAFDCSGLTSWAYQQVGKSIPRTSQAQASQGTAVSSPALGDIVSFYSGATHVGIFSGNGNVIHAPQSGDVVKEAPMNYMPVHNFVRF